MLNLTDKLSALYRSYGYRQFKVNKFEEYDYYARNKDFLVSNRIISFTDTNGKLMALKPDVTLSVIKNSKDDADITQRMYYNENVYRVSKGSGNFRENSQTGLECIGYIDDYCIFETLILAALSLNEISPDFILDISDLDLIPRIMNIIDLPEQEAEKALGFIGNKDIHDLKKLCEKNNVSEEGFCALSVLISAYGSPSSATEKLKEMPEGFLDKEAFEKLCKITLPLEKELPGKINIDFSVMSDINYYNGFIFNGFISGVPRAVLSGGQYDKLLSGMGRKSKGLGFAVFMDALEFLNKKEEDLDSDVLIIYKNDNDPEMIYKKASEYTSKGKSVTLLKKMPGEGRFGEVISLG